MIDFNLENSKEPVLESHIDIILQSINILMETTPKELLGDLEYGTSYEDFLYDTKIGEDAIKTRVYQDLGSIDLGVYQPQVEVYFLEGSERDIILVDITLIDYKKQEKYNKTYAIK